MLSNPLPPPPPYLSPHPSQLLYISPVFIPVCNVMKGYGGMRIWKMSSTPTLMCTIRAAVNRLDSVNSMCCDAQHEHVVVGDTGGHVRVWRLDPKLCSCTGPAAEACFTQVIHNDLLPPQQPPKSPVKSSAILMPDTSGAISRCIPATTQGHMGSNHSASS